MNLRDFADGDNLALRELIAARIAANGGSLRFDDYLRLALYDSVHGYYVRYDPALDYQTSPRVHTVFGACIARQLIELWRLLDRPARFDVFEAGAGDCRLAADVLRGLRREAPDCYDAVRYRVQDVAFAAGAAATRLETAGVPLDKVEVVAELPSDTALEGCILSNELLDALPFRRVRRREGSLYELHVSLEDGRLIDVEAPAPPAIEAYFAALGVLPGEGCDAEVNLEAPAWLTSAAKALRRGYVLTFDYGYPAADLYAPWRRRGTLLTFYRHTSGDDAYTRVGRQDVTASVDFTAVRLAGEAAGLRTAGLTTQSELLAALGVGEALARPPAADAIEAYYALRRAVITLTDPVGLGRIRALLQAKDAPLGPFAAFPPLDAT